MGDNIIFLSEDDQKKMGDEIDFVANMPWNSFAGKFKLPYIPMSIAIIMRNKRYSVQMAYPSLYQGARMLDTSMQLQMAQKQFLILMMII